MRICRLMYSSYAAPNLNYPDLLDIMQKSEINNIPAGLTGMLCFGDDIFLQVLEGGRKAVSQTYHRIAQDQRHFGAEIIECVEVDSRLFSTWSMKTIQLGDYFPEKIKELILKYSPSSTFIPSTMSPKQCLDFMLEVQALYNSAAT